MTQSYIIAPVKVTPYGPHGSAIINIDGQLIRFNAEQVAQYIKGDPWEECAAWHREQAEIQRNLSDMNLPAVSPTVARAKAKWHEESAQAIRSQGDKA